MVHFPESYTENPSESYTENPSETESNTEKPSESYTENPSTTETISAENAEIMESSVVNGAVEFETSGFSVYVVVEKVVTCILENGDKQNYKITVAYDTSSGIPENAELEVLPLEKGTKEYDAYVQKTAEALGREVRHLSFAYAFDISLVDPETGEHYQPSKDASVSVELLNEDIDDGDMIDVIHFPGSDSNTDVNDSKDPEVLESSINGGVVDFKTNGFSIYIVAGEELMQHFVFLNDTDGRLNETNRSSYIFAEQVLINGESLIAPPDPSKSGAVFSHWSTTAGGDAVTFPIEVVINEDDVDELEIENAPNATTKEKKQAWLDAHPTYYYAVYGAPKTFITFYNQSGLVVERREVTKPTGADPVTFNTRDVKYIPVQDKENAVYIFKYWTDDPRGSGLEAGSNGVITIDSNSDDEIELWPKLDEGHYIYFDSNTASYSEMSSAEYTGPETVVNGQSSAAEVCESLNDRDNHAIPTANGYVFKGWYIRMSDSHDDDDDSAATKTNPVFYPNENGTLSVNATEYGKLLNSFNNLPNNPTLYAHWTKKTTADYTVVIWKQKLTDDGTAASDEYSFVESGVRSGSTTEEITLDSSYTTKANNVTESSPYYGFYYSKTDPEGEFTIKPDGTTVINVYYDRIVHTMTFLTDDNFTQNNNGEYYYFPGGYIKNGQDYDYYDKAFYLVGSSYGPYTGNITNNSSKDYYNYYNYKYNKRSYKVKRYNVGSVTRSISAAYGASISTYFPIKDSNDKSYEGYTWKDVYPGYYEYILSTVDIMPNVDVTFYGTYNGKEKTIYYYVEVDSSEETRSFNGKSYKLYKTVKHNYNYITYNEEYHELNGYSRDPSHADPVFSDNRSYPSNNINYLYYDRKSYNIHVYDTLISKTTATRSISALFNSSVADAMSDVSYAHEGYWFTGWYTDPECTVRAYFTQEEYEASALTSKEKVLTMPAYDIQLYAGWTQPTYEIRLIPNGAELGDQSWNFWIDPDEKITLADPTRDYIPVDARTGAYDYDSTKGNYTENAENKGNYNGKAGAYIFQGWYKAEVEDDTLETVEWDPEGHPGEYSTSYADPNPKTDSDGNYVVSNTEFNQGTPPNSPVVLVAMWQRAGDFRVVYDTVDPAINNAAVTEPEDLDEYMDGSHAVVKAAITAPKGYTLDYWTDKQGHVLHPNVLVAVNENNATVVGSEMQVILTAHYRKFEPNERNMADYTFKAKKVKKDNSGFDGGYIDYEVQRISINEELKAPITPDAPDGYAFRGWYYDAEGTRRFDGFGVITNPTYTTLYAVYDQVFHVNYYLTEIIDGVMTKTDKVIATQTYKNPDDGNYEYLDTRHIKHNVDLDHYVTMWVSDWNDQNNAEKQYEYNSLSNKQVKSDINLYAVLQERSYVYFNSCGGSPVDQQEIPVGGWPVRPKDPTREGYEFLGWYTAQNGGTKYEFDRLISDVDSVTGSTHNLYAHWEAKVGATANITLIWWAETAKENIFQYQKAESRAVQVGSEFSQSTLTDEDKSTVNIVSSDNEGKQDYFEFSSAKTDDSVVVNGDGSTVFNIRLTRKRYTIKFKPPANVTIKTDASTTYNSSNMYSFTAWIDKEIAAQWPIKRDGYPQLVGADAMKWTSEKDTSVFVTSVPTVLQTSLLNVADSNNVIQLNGIKVDYDCTNIIRYYLDGEEDLSLRATLKGEDVSEYLGTYKHNNKDLKYSYYYAFRDVPGYSVVTTPLADSTKFNVKKEDLYSKDGDWSKYVDDRVLPQYEKGSTTSGTETYTYTSYSYSRKDTVKYYVGTKSANLVSYTYAFTPVTITFDNSSEKKDSYTISANGQDITGSDIYYVADGEDPTYYGNWVYEVNNTTQISWDSFINAAIQETTETKTGTRVISAGTTQCFSFFYSKNSYNVKLFINRSDTEPYRTVTVPYKDYVPDALSAEGISDPPVPAGMEGKEFDCWSESPSARVPFDKNMPAYDVTLYATWKDKTYTVTTIGVDADGHGFLANADGVEVDADGNVVENGKTSAVYTKTSEGNDIVYGTMIKELNISNPTMNSKIFKGWVDNSKETAVVKSRKITENMVIKPLWDSLETRTVTYDANFPDGLDYENNYENIDDEKYAPFESDKVPTAPVDTNKYVIGARVTLKDSNGLYINRRDVDGKVYKATLAFWEDANGTRYYPNTTYVFRENSPEVLELKAVYSQYRETRLYYNLNAPQKENCTVTAKFVLQDATQTDYKDHENNKLVTEGTHKGEVRVLFRDKMSEDWGDSFKKKPNDNTYIVGEDEFVDTENINTNPNLSKFTAVCSDDIGNDYTFAGWATTPDACIKVFANGDRAYVNTINEETDNTLYAVWGVCKVVDKKNVEYVFTSIQKAVDWVQDPDNKDILPEVNGVKTGTIQMLCDYVMSDPVVIRAEGEEIGDSVASDASVVLTTASKTATFTGETFFYNGSGTDGRATISQGTPNFQVFTVTGDFTLKNIIMDSDKETEHTFGIVLMKDNGNVTLDTGATIQNAHVQVGTNQDSSGGAIRAIGNGTITLKSGSLIDDCIARDGGAIYLEHEKANTLNIESGAVISNCNCYYWGGAIQVNGNNSVVNMKEGAKIENCKAGQLKKTDGSLWTTDGCGGAICINLGGVVNINSGAEISGCEAHRGGGVYVVGSNNNTLNLEGTITNCNAVAGGSSGSLGGGLYQAGSTVVIDNGMITDCNAENGGGVYQANGKLHLGKDQNVNSSAVISNCTAQNGGGIYQTGGTLSHRNSSSISNCIASISGGGVYQNGGEFYLYDTASVTYCEARTDENKYDTTNLGGGFYLNGGTLKLFGDTKNDVHGKIESCKAYDGGGVYQGGGTLKEDGKISPSGTIYIGDNNNLRKGTVLSNCEAIHDGAGIYVANGLDADNPVQLNMSYGSITNNEAGNMGGGIAVGGTNVKLNFSGSAVVQNNTMPNPDVADDTVTCNVCLDQNSNGIINSSGLNADAYVGVYVTGNMTTEPYKTHGQMEQDFGSTVPTATNLYRFVSDRDNLFGEIDPKNTSLIRWNAYLCKLTAENGNLLYKDQAGKEPALYFSFASKTGAIGDRDSGNNTGGVKVNLYYSNGKGYAKDKPIRVEMLRDYTQLSTDIFDLAHITRKVTLTTASTTPTDTDPYIYNSGSETTAVITRGFNGHCMIDHSGSGILELKNITIDGGSEKNFECVSQAWCKKNNNGNGGIAYVWWKSTLILGEGATLQNSKAKNGGAVYLFFDTSASYLKMEGGKIKNCSASEKGGAVYVAAKNSCTIQDGSEISGNTATSGGAGIYLEQGSTMNIKGAPQFSGNITGTATVTNGGEENTPQYQDIYLQGTATPLNLLNVTGKITSATGSIRVWAENENHYKESEQFAVLDASLLTDGKVDTTKISEADLKATLSVFRNARADSDTTESGTRSDYLYGVTGENASYVYWGREQSITVNKKWLDSSGNDVTNTVTDKTVHFELYQVDKITGQGSGNIPVTMLGSSDSKGTVGIGDTVSFVYKQEVDDVQWKQYITDNPDGSMTNNSIDTKANYTLVNGKSFSFHIYYRCRNSSGNGYDDHNIEPIDPAILDSIEVSVSGNTTTILYNMHFVVKSKEELGITGEEFTYTKIEIKNNGLNNANLISVGVSSIENEAYQQQLDKLASDADPVRRFELKDGVWQTTIVGLDSKYSYLVKEVSVNTGTQVETDLSNYDPQYSMDSSGNTTVSNLLSSITRRVILRKTNEDSKSLAGARFRIFKSSFTEFTDGRETGKTYYESDSSGVYFCGDLPLGTYYLLEVVAPSGVGSSNTGKVFELTVSDTEMKAEVTTEVTQSDLVKSGD